MGKIRTAFGADKQIELQNKDIFQILILPCYTGYMKIERHDVEIEREVLVAFTQTFINRYDCFPVQNPQGSYLKLNRQLTFEQVEQHLLGQITIGAYALNEGNNAKWLCLDADTDAEWQGLHTLAANLDRQGIPAYLEPSRRGGHVWLFFTPLPGPDVRRFAKFLLAQHGLDGLEVYPRQDALRTGPGSLVRLPLGFHRKTDPPHRFTFKTLQGDDLAPTVREQIALLAQPCLVPHGFIHEVIAAIPEPPSVTPSKPFKRRQTVEGTPADRIKAAISVKDFVSQYVDLDRNGRGLCPFHDDHRMSFSVSEDGNYWHCFAGCEGQTMIDFYMQYEEVDFRQAIRDLAELYLPPLP